VADIDAAGRHRKDMGDLDALADSIRAVGLLQPVVVTARKKLIAGERRLRAVAKLGWEAVPAYVVDGLADAAALLRAERDENTCRKEFTPSEAVAIGKALEDLERAQAQGRQQGSRAKKGQQVGAAQGGGNFPPPAPGKTRDRVGEAVGMSGKTYEKAKEVVWAAEQDPEQFGPIKDEMDATGKVDPAYRKVKGKQEGRQEEGPPDLAGVFGGAGADINRLTYKLRQSLAPHWAGVNEASPEAADKFRSAASRLIRGLDQFFTAVPPLPSEQEEGDLHRHLDNYRRDVQGMLENLEPINEDAWALFGRSRWASRLKELAESSERLTELLRKAWSQAIPQKGKAKK
jgi:ParB family chromosome partitioning protein